MARREQSRVEGSGSLTHLPPQLHELGPMGSDNGRQRPIAHWTGRLRRSRVQTRSARRLREGNRYECT